MKAAAQFGSVLGVLMVALDALHIPVASAVFWAIAAVFNTIYAVLTWRRTRMFWMTLAGAYGAIGCMALMLLSVAGYGLRDLTSLWPRAFWANATAAIVLALLAHGLDRDRYRRWKQHTQGMTLLDLLRFRHIPHLREPA